MFLALTSGTVAAHDLADGKELWSVPIAVDQPMAAADGRLFVAAGETVSALGAADGKEIWAQKVGAVTAPLLVREGWMIVATKEQLRALHAADGKEVWSRELSLVTQRPTIEGETLFVPIEEGRIVALALTTGQTIWDQQVAKAPTEPFAYADRLYFGTDAKKLQCMKSKDGRPDWSFDVGARIIGRSTADAERVYFTSMDNVVRALDRISGNRRWPAVLTFRPLSGPVLIGQYVAIGGLAPEVDGFDPKTGKPIGKLTLEDPIGAAPTFVAVLKDAPAIVVMTVNAKQEWKLSLAGPPELKPPGDPKPYL